MEKKVRKIIVISSLALFIISLTQKAYCTTNLCRSSIDAFLTGTVGFFYGGAAMCWLANPMIIAAWITFHKRMKASLLLSFFALCGTSSFLFFHSIVDNEAGHINNIIYRGPGYFMWFFSSIIMLIGNSCVFLFYRHKENLSI